MKFLPDGPDIPDELIAAQERGQTIFICGAGVSMSLGLPSFGGLVQKVYDELNEDWEIHAAEREGMAEGGKLFGQYDRVLRCLERRLVGNNPGRSSRMRDRIRAAVRTALQPPADDVELANHAALLELSRDAEGTIRLVTTNFDTLFERAWTRNGKAPSYAGAAMPQPKTAGCEGILHLHGRLKDEGQDLPDTDLVLTSAEFGDAYLRSGWASRYIYDLARAYTVVLVGYQADDPPMRYLLEVLEADRERYPDLQQVYAFSSPGRDGAELTDALWRAKGVRPIIHDANERDFSPLWNTLREWRTYQADPTTWRREQLRPLLAQPPRDLEQHEIDRAASLLGHGDASQLLADLSPLAAWLPALVEARTFDNQKASPGQWIADHIDDPDMIRAAAALHRLDDNTVWYLERALERDREALAPHRIKAWELILNAKSGQSARDHDLRWYQIAKRVRSGDAGYESRRVVASLLRPRLVIQRPYSLFDDEPQELRPESLSSLITIDFKSSRAVPSGEILEAWPADREATLNLIGMLDRALVDALEQAEGVGFLSGWDRSDHDVPSVAQHGQNRYRQDFYSLVRLLADLWERLAQLDEDAARDLAGTWSASRFTLHKRLALFGATNPMIPPDDAVKFVMVLGDYVFWASGAQVEIMKLLTARWNEFAEEDRLAIEARVRAGIPRALYDDAEFEEDRWESILDDSIFRRLKRLEEAGCVLEETSQQTVADIVARRPRWRPSAGDRDDFHSWHETSYGPDGNPELLAGVPDAELLESALKIQRERMFDQGNLWRKFCSADPERALRGLTVSADGGEHNAEAWRCLIWAIDEKAEPDLHAQLAAQLLRMPDAPVETLRGTIADWLRRKRELLELLPADHSTVYWTLWDRLAEQIFAGPDYEGDPAGNQDLAMHAYNSAGGTLAWTLCEALGARKPGNAVGLGDLEPRFARIAASTNHAGLLGRYHFAVHLSYLERVAPAWVETEMLPHLRWGAAEAVELWRALSQEGIGSPQLFTALLPDLKLALESGRLRDHASQNLASYLLQILVWHQRGNGLDYDFEPPAFRRLMTTAPAEIRQHIAWSLWRLASPEKDDEEDSAARWRTLVGPLFTAIWPLDINLRSAEVSDRLVHMVLETEDAFPEAVEAVAYVLVPYQLYSFAHSLRLEDRHRDLLQRFPKPYLVLSNAIIDPALFPLPDDLADVLAECVEADPSVTEMAEYRRLDGLRRQAGA
ncbi:SIR2 family protein [Brevundimonas diminuta]|uniref:SIR2 family protein n=1 Tax=Brevundimonas diminuta TaxID=293 RepID=UPI0022AFAC7F|nr:SIR2 family protein [Brevundimonas diminuta]MCZ4109310.1 SIR2 family protein [Brevundimonas diminuta]